MCHYEFLAGSRLNRFLSGLYMSRTYGRWKIINLAIWAWKWNGNYWNRRRSFLFSEKQFCSLDVRNGDSILFLGSNFRSGSLTGWKFIPSFIGERVNRNPSFNHTSTDDPSGTEGKQLLFLGFTESKSASIGKLYSVVYTNRLLIFHPLFRLNLYVTKETLFRDSRAGKLIVLSDCTLGSLTEKNIFFSFSLEKKSEELSFARIENELSTGKQVRVLKGLISLLPLSCDLLPFARVAQ